MVINRGKWPWQITMANNYGKPKTEPGVVKEAEAKKPAAYQ
ncbi:hypothetical protein GCM10025791_21810 [Halioxenophilus aromaticivorans]|uniref:Uncharacterized protein n=1 Tax=Halioxenophilus aromaticivorans TaxID=1306992 RepID=A0AAV3U2V3_9ALTE